MGGGEQDIREVCPTLLTVEASLTEHYRESGYIEEGVLLEVAAFFTQNQACGDLQWSYVKDPREDPTRAESRRL